MARSGRLKSTAGEDSFDSACCPSLTVLRLTTVLALATATASWATRKGLIRARVGGPPFSSLDFPPVRGGIGESSYSDGSTTSDSISSPSAVNPLRVFSPTNELSTFFFAGSGAASLTSLAAAAAAGFFGETVSGVLTCSTGMLFCGVALGLAFGLALVSLRGDSFTASSCLPFVSLPLVTSFFSAVAFVGDATFSSLTRSTMATTGADCGVAGVAVTVG
uniref:(northern house mosquito) hypothetical protein n=1 Tax=Culex pipiens TaxID=7175 RepID=A0A8D8BPR5_CULPI